MQFLSHLIVPDCTDLKQVGRYCKCRHYHEKKGKQLRLSNMNNTLCEYNLSVWYIKVLNIRGVSVSKPPPHLKDGLWMRWCVICRIKLVSSRTVWLRLFPCCAFLLSSIIQAKCSLHDTNFHLLKYIPWHKPIITLSLLRRFTSHLNALKIGL